MSTRWLLTAALLLPALSPHLPAAVAYDESVSGDLSNKGLAPTAVALSPGSNLIRGTTGRVTAVDRDYFTVTVPAGFALTAVDELAGTTVGGAVSFIGVESGPQLTLPTNATDASGLLGWWHYAPTATDVNILPDLAIPADKSSGFTAPLGAGTYTFWIQDFGAGTFHYAFDFELQALNPIVNVSGRGFVGTGDNILISGLAVTGAQPKRVLVRACGPALTALGVGAALADPALQIVDAHGVVVAANTGWGTAANAADVRAAAATVGAFPCAAGSGDSAILTTLSPGVYSIELRGAAGDTGDALIEIYDADASPTNQLSNSSIRSWVGGDAGVQIAGFVVGGSQPKSMLVRAAGAALGAMGFAGTLAHPTLTIFDAQGAAVATNTGWGNASNAAAIKSAAAAVNAFPLADGSADSAVLASLPPGQYTAVVSGAAGESGMSLLEIYAVDGH